MEEKKVSNGQEGASNQINQILRAFDELGTTVKERKKLPYHLIDGEFLQLKEVAGACRLVNDICVESRAAIDEPYVCIDAVRVIMDAQIENLNSIMESLGRIFEIEDDDFQETEGESPEIPKKEAVGGLKKLEAMVEAKDGEGNDLNTLPGDICMEAFKLKALADLTFCETLGDEIIFQNSNNACGFSMLLSDIADRIQKVAGQIETGFIPRKAPEPGERGAI